LHARSEQERQHDQPELGERAEVAEGLDRAGAADDVDVTPLVRRAQLVEHALRVAVPDHVLGGAGRALRGQATASARP